MMIDIVAFTDGGSRGNPGPSACAVWFPQLNKIVSRFINIATNNEAEYLGLILALQHTIELWWDDSVKLKVYSDSELVVKQVRGEYKVHNSRMFALWETVQVLISRLEGFEIHHIPRDENTKADAAVNECMDRMSTFAQSVMSKP